MRKWFSTGIACGFLAIPLAVISCSQVTSTRQKVSEYSASPELAVAIKNTNVVDDGIYFWKNTYQDGVLWDGTIAGHESTNDGKSLVPMAVHNTPSGQTNVVEMGDGDKFYVLFDKDDKDGLAACDFEKELGIIDTSYIGNQLAIDEVNEQYGNEIIGTGWNKSLFVTFKNGQSNGYVGSQSNHMGGTFAEAMAKIRAKTSNEVFDALTAYYQTASHSFSPVVMNKGMFTSKKVANNAFEITYHYSGVPLTAAALALKPTNGATILKYYNWSLGTENEWKAYEGYFQQGSTTMVARKNVFINNLATISGPVVTPIKIPTTSGNKAPSTTSSCPQPLHAQGVC